MNFDDQLVHVILEFSYCRQELKGEFLEGLELGFNIAKASIEADFPFSQELYKYLISQRGEAFSLKKHFDTLKQIENIVVTDAMLVSSQILMREEYRADYVNAIRIGYEISMKAFLEIVRNFFVKKTCDLYIHIYKSTFEAFINGLKFTLMEIK
jgi:hypothetical protein